MNKSDAMKNLIEENNGYLVSAQAVEKGFTKPFISNYIKSHQMEKAAPGIYILEEIWPDELFILQTRNKMIIYSGETGLYLHGLIDREYSKICFSVPTGYNASHIKNSKKKIQYLQKDIYEMGVCVVPSMSGNLVRVYDMERCICDMVKKRSDYEVQVFQTAMKEYMSHRKKNLSHLVEYAQTLGIRDEVMKYVEVLV